MPRDLSGREPAFYIASPQMKDPFFERTVVLVWHHDDHGAIGVVVNRHLEHTLGDVLDTPEQLGPDGEPLAPRNDVPVAWGGPVDTGTGTVVTLGHIEEDEGWVMPDGLAVTRSQDALVRLLKGGAPLMLCLGYAGWGAGQLEREIHQGSWLWTDCDARIVFETPPEKRYDRALATLGLTPTSVWMKPIDE